MVPREVRQLEGRIQNRSRLPLASLVPLFFFTVLLGALPAGAAPNGWTTTQQCEFSVALASGSTGTLIGTDTAGNRFVGGSFHGSVTFGSGPGGTLSASGDQAFIAAFGPSGVFKWARRISSGYGSTLAGLAVMPSGDVVVHGTSWGPTHISTIWTDRVLTSYGQRDLFTAVLGAADGHIVWAQSAGSAGTDEAGDVGVDGYGNVYVTGSFSQAATFGTAPSTSTISSKYFGDAYVASFTSGGTLRFAADIAPGGQESKGTGLTIAGGALFVIGRFTGAVTIGSATLTSTKAGAFQGFVTRLDASSAAVGWVRFTRGATSSDDGPALTHIARLSDGALAVTGTFTDAIGYGPPGFPPASTLPNPVDTDAVILRILPTGQLTWMRSLGSSHFARADGVTAGPSGSITVIGSFQGTLALDGANLSSGSNSNIDGYLTEMSAAGAVDRAASFGSTGGDHGYGVAGASSGNPVIVGDLGANATLPGGVAAASDGGFYATLAQA